MWIRCSAAAAGTWGYSGDTTNQIHLLGCRFESSSIQSSTPFLSVDSSSRAVHATHIYCYANDFANTAPAGTTAPSMITWQGQASSLSNVLYANSLAVAFNGTAPTTFAPGTPLPQINGTVSDASFATAPANGTMAVNTAAKTLCIRVNGTWLSTPLT